MADETFRFQPRMNKQQLEQIGDTDVEPEWDWPDPPTVMAWSEFKDLSAKWNASRSKELMAVDEALKAYNAAYDTWSKAKTSDNCANAYTKLDELRTAMRKWGFAKLLKYADENESVRAMAMAKLRDQVFIGWVPRIFTEEELEMARAFQNERRLRFRALLAGKRLEFKAVVAARKKNKKAAFKEIKRVKKEANKLAPLAEQLAELTGNAVGAAKNLLPNGAPLPDLAALLPLLEVAAAIGDKLPSGWLPNMKLPDLGGKLGLYFRSKALAGALPAFLKAIRPPKLNMSFIDAVQSQLADIGKLSKPKLTDLLPKDVGLSPEQVIGPLKAILAILESMPLDELDKIVPDSLVPSALLDPMSPAITDLKIGLTSVLAAFDLGKLQVNLEEIENQAANIKAAILSAADTIKNLSGTIKPPSIDIPLYNDTISIGQRLGSWIANMLATGIRNILDDEALLVLQQTLDTFLSLPKGDMAADFLGFFADVVGIDILALAAAMVPFLSTAVYGAKAAKAVYAAYQKLKQANQAEKYGKAFTQAKSAQLALDGLRKLIQESMKDQLERAAKSVAAFGASLATDLGMIVSVGFMGVAKPALAIAAALESAVSALIHFGEAVRQSIEVNKLLEAADREWAKVAKNPNQGIVLKDYPLDEEIIEKSPVLGCYMIAYAQPDELLHMVVLPKDENELKNKPYKLGEVHWDPNQEWTKQLGVIAERHLDPLRKIAKRCLDESMLVLDGVHEWAVETPAEGTTATKMKEKCGADKAAMLKAAKGAAQLLVI